MPRVIFIGTEPHMLSSLQSRFEQEGFEVASAGAADEWQVSEFPPDLIVLGKRLGDTVSHALSSVADVPIILLTAGDEEGVGNLSQPITQLKMPFRPSHLLELARKTMTPV